jgi:hypothetical protein
MTAHIHQNKAKYAALGIWYSLALASSTVRQTNTEACKKELCPLKKGKGRICNITNV